MSFHMCNLVELVSLPYCYFLHSDIGEQPRSIGALPKFFPRLKPDVCTISEELVPRTEEGKMLGLNCS